LPLEKFVCIFSCETFQLAIKKKKKKKINGKVRHNQNSKYNLTDDFVWAGGAGRQQQATQLQAPWTHSKYLHSTQTPANLNHQLTQLSPAHSIITHLTQLSPTTSKPTMMSWRPLQPCVPTACDHQDLKPESSPLAA